MKHHYIDFTKGNIIRNLIMFSVPIILGELLQNLYNSVDALVIGNFVGKNALAAVNVSSIISAMLIMFFTGMSFGSNVVVSRKFGEKDAAGINSAVQATFTFSVILGVVLSVAGIFATPGLLELAGTQEAYYQEALTYLRVYLIGLMFTVIYNNGAGILRALGDSDTPFYILVVTCVINIVLDLAFVALIGMGILGVALATIISQGISAVLIYLTINKTCRINCFNIGKIKEEKSSILDAITIGMATGIQNAVTAFSNLFVVRYMNNFSTDFVAGIGVAQRIDKFVGMPARSLGITATTYVSQNLGAGNVDRVKKGKSRVILLAVAVAVLLGIPIYIFAEFFVGLFSSAPEVVNAGSDMLRVLIPFLSFSALREVFSGIMRGYKITFWPMILTLCGMVGFRQVYLAICYASGMTVRNIYWCYPLAWIVATSLVFIYYLSRKKSMKI